jgi:hypothetical protein
MTWQKKQKTTVYIKYVGKYFSAERLLTHKCIMYKSFQKENGHLLFILSVYLIKESMYVHST